MIFALPEEFFTVHGWKKRPLPNQKQLQSTLGLTPIKFIEEFYEYAQEPLKETEDPEIFKVDMECFTLAYVVDRKYGKYFDGEKWI
jgi:hypothetical protein